MNAANANLTEAQQCGADAKAMNAADAGSSNERCLCDTMHTTEMMAGVSNKCKYDAGPRLRGLEPPTDAGTDAGTCNDTHQKFWLEPPTDAGTMQVRCWSLQQTDATMQVQMLEPPTTDAGTTLYDAHFRKFGWSLQQMQVRCRCGAGASNRYRYRCWSLNRCKYRCWSPPGRLSEYKNLDCCRVSDFDRPLTHSVSTASFWYIGLVNVISFEACSARAFVFGCQPVAVHFRLSASLPACQDAVASQPAGNLPADSACFRRLGVVL